MASRVDRVSKWVWEPDYASCCTPDAELLASHFPALLRSQNGRKRTPEMDQTEAVGKTISGILDPFKVPLDCWEANSFVSGLQHKVYLIFMYMCPNINISKGTTDPKVEFIFPK